jgi:preprotein translocase subunit YajC
MENIWILAQSESGQPTMIESEQSEGQEHETISVPSDSNSNVKQAVKKGPLGDYSGIILIVLMVVVMYFFLMRGPRKKQQEHKQLVQSLKKNDKVRTIGGIIGTIVDIKDDEITLKIDETNNTKIKVIPSAIGRNLSQGQN